MSLHCTQVVRAARVDPPGLLATGSDSREELLLKALTLYDVAVDAVNKGQLVALLGQDDRLIREVVGLGQSRSEAASEVARPEGVAS